MESRRVPRRVVKCNLKKEASLPALRTPVHPVLGQRPEKEAESSGLVYNSARKEQLFRTLFSTNPHLRSRLIPGIETPSYLTSWYAFLHTYAHPRGALYNPYNEPSIDLRILHPCSCLYPSENAFERLIDRCGRVFCFEFVILEFWGIFDWDFVWLNVGSTLK